MKKLLRFVPAVLIMAVIFIFSAQSGESSSVVSDAVVEKVYGSESVGTDKLTVLVRKSAHFLEYAALGAALAFGVSGSAGKRLTALISLIISAVYAASDELHQYFVPGRACQGKDVLLDTLGAAVGIAAFLLVSALFQKNKNKLTRKE